MKVKLFESKMAEEQSRIKAIEARYEHLFAEYNVACKPIRGYTGYLIYRNGSVENLRNKTDPWAKSFIDSDGYTIVRLLDYSDKANPMERIERLHILIARAFIPNKKNKGEVDHVDKNKSNNDVSNLRWATRKQNSMNIKPKEGHSSLYKGVGWIECKGIWRAQIKIDGVSCHIGQSFNEAEAAYMYDNVAWEKYGYYAHLNFPELIPDYKVPEIIKGIPWGYTLDQIKESKYLINIHFLYIQKKKDRKKSIQAMIKPKE